MPTHYDTVLSNVNVGTNLRRIYHTVLLDEDVISDVQREKCHSEGSDKKGFLAESYIADRRQKRVFFRRRTSLPFAELLERWTNDAPALHDTVSAHPDVSQVASDDTVIHDDSLRIPEKKHYL